MDLGIHHQEEIREIREIREKMIVDFWKLIFSLLLFFHWFKVFMYFLPTKTICTFFWTRYFIFSTEAFLNLNLTIQAIAPQFLFFNMIHFEFLNSACCVVVIEKTGWVVKYSSGAIGKETTSIGGSWLIKESGEEFSGGFWLGGVGFLRRFGVIVGVFFDNEDVPFRLRWIWFGWVFKVGSWGFGIESFFVEFVLGRSFGGHESKIQLWIGCAEFNFS